MYKKRIAWNKGKTLSEEHKRKIGISSSKRKHTEETKMKMRIAQSGKNNPRYGKTVSVEVKAKISQSMKGKSRSKETIMKWKKSYAGHKQSAKTKLNMSLCEKGDKHPNWQGGISTYPYIFTFNSKLKKVIKIRDSYTCKLCRRKEKNNSKLKAYESFRIHHIDYDKINSDFLNLITLCPSCHSKTNFNRNYWRLFFNKKIIKLCA